jgi:hypothetical protein
MKYKRLFMRLVPVAVLLASPAAFAIKIPTGTKDFDLNIGVLLQARAAANWDGDAPSATQGAAPNGSVDTSFYLRRARLIVSGAAWQKFTFYLMLDEPNFGIRGNYNITNNPAFVQDLHIGYEFEPGTAIEAGFLYMPLSHLAINSSAATASIEKNSVILFYNNSRGLRETGIHFRTVFLDRKIYLRAGVFSGLHGLQGSDITAGPNAGAVVNPGGRPLVAGMLRYSFVGTEAGYSVPTMYLDGKTRVSVGVGAQYQIKGSNTPRTTINAAGARATANTAVNDFIAYAGDVFADIALPNDQELDVQLDFYRFDWGAGSDKTGYGATGEVGYRIGSINPEVNGHWFNSESKQGNFAKFAAGVNYLFKGHSAKVGVEFWHFKSNVNWDASAWAHQVLAQFQASF